MGEITNDSWAIEISNDTFNEAIQRIAFSFGYEWVAHKSPNQVFRYRYANYLHFYPDMKDIAFSYTKTGANKIKYVKTLEEAMDLFKNPPEKRLSLFGGVVTIFRNGDVVFHNNFPTFTSDEFEHIKEQRKKFLICN